MTRFAHFLRVLAYRAETPARVTVLSGGRRRTRRHKKGPRSAVTLAARTAKRPGDGSQV